MTKREAQVLVLCRSAPPRSVAATLAVSVRTVEKHLQHVYEKMGVSTLADALAVACAAGTMS